MSSASRYATSRFCCFGFVRCSNKLVMCYESVQAGAVFQLTTGAIGFLCLWTVISPLMFGTCGFILVNLHFLLFLTTLSLC
jgi:hypothetical protein